ncbi:MAG: RsbRD N-terminal domain-containing protein [Desulfobacteraceae bacterium]|jgi:hypothetical protein
MGLAELLERKKNDIIDLWFDHLMKSYPPDTAQFYKGQKDPFANPVGTTTKQGLSKIFNEILGDMDRKTLVANLDTIIRIRAIQNFTPSDALAFIFELKKILRKALKKELKNIEQLEILNQIENKIDRLNMMAFDIYLQCREKIYELKVSTEREKIYKAFARAGLITEAFEEEEPGLKAS